MKKTRPFLLIAMFFVSSLAFAGEVEVKNPTDPQARVEQLENRVLEIWKMNLDDLGVSEKEALRLEVKSIKKEIKEVKGLDDKVTLSVGAIIIILLLLILLT